MPTRYSFPFITFLLFIFTNIVLRFSFRESSFHFLSFYLILSALFGGLGPGIIATLLAVSYYILINLQTSGINTYNIISVIALIFVGISVGFLSEAKRQLDIQKDEFIRFASHELKNPQAKNGILINGHSLYGYTYIKKVEEIKDGIKQTQAARYEINEEEARVVKMIYDWVGNERISLKEVIRRLYDKGIPPRKRKSEFWTHGPIVRLLSCETYAKGVVYYNKHESVVAKKPIKNDKYKKIKRSSRRLRPKEDWIPFYNIPKLIDLELFKKVQKILNYNQKYACKKRKYDYLLSGLAACQCGSPRVGDGVDGRNFYYRCSERIYKFPMEKQCKLQGLNAVALDEAFWKELVKFMTSPNRLKKHIERWFKEQANNEVDRLERERLTGLINKIVEEEKRYAKAYGAKTLEFETFKDLVKDARKRKETYQKELDALNSKITQQGIDKIQFAEVYNEAKRVLQAQDLENRPQTTRDLIDKIIIKERRLVEVKGHIPLFTQNMGYEPISWNCRVAKCWKVNFI